MALANQHDNHFYEHHGEELQGIRTLLLLLSDSLQGKPGEQAMTYLADKVAQSLRTMESWYQHKTKVCLLAWALLTLYSCTVGWPMQWQDITTACGIDNPYDSS